MTSGGRSRNRGVGRGWGTGWPGGGIPLLWPWQQAVEPLGDRATARELFDELARATNRFGRARAFSSSNERARTAVQKAVRRALDHVAHEDQALGALLRASVRTGRTCCYDPTPGAPARWTALTLA